MQAARLRYPQADVTAVEERLRVVQLVVGAGVILVLAELVGEYFQDLAIVSYVVGHDTGPDHGAACPNYVGRPNGPPPHHGKALHGTGCLSVVQLRLERLSGTEAVSPPSTDPVMVTEAPRSNVSAIPTDDSPGFGHGSTGSGGGSGGGGGGGDGEGGSGWRVTCSTVAVCCGGGGSSDIDLRNSRGVRMGNILYLVGAQSLSPEKGRAARRCVNQIALRTFDLTTRRWRVCSPAPRSIMRGFVGAAVAVGARELWLLGARPSSHGPWSSRTAAYNVATDRWRRGPNMRGARRGNFVGFAVGSRIHVRGGGRGEAVETASALPLPLPSLRTPMDDTAAVATAATAAPPVPAASASAPDTENERKGTHAEPETDVRVLVYSSGYTAAVEYSTTADATTITAFEIDTADAILYDAHADTIFSFRGCYSSAGAAADDDDDDDSAECRSPAQTAPAWSTVLHWTPFNDGHYHDADQWRAVEGVHLPYFTHDFQLFPHTPVAAAVGRPRAGVVPIV